MIWKGLNKFMGKMVLSPRIIFFTSLALRAASSWASKELDPVAPTPDPLLEAGTPF